MSIHTIKLPETGFVRLTTILGNPNSNPPVPAIIPVSRTVWFDGVRSGLYPQPVKLSARTVAWRVEDIRSLIERINTGGGDHGR